MEDDSILPTPNWALLIDRIKDHPTFNTTFFGNVNPVVQNVFLLSLRQMEMQKLQETFISISSVFSVEQLTDVRDILEACNFNSSEFGL